MSRRRRRHEMQGQESMQVSARLEVGSGIGWRIRRFLGSGGHILGTVLAIVGIVMLDGGMTSGWVGIALIPFLYATGYFIATRPRVAAPVGPTMAKDAPQIRDALDELIGAIRPRVSEDVFRRVVSIRDAIVFTLDHAGLTSEADPNVYLVRQTARTYLPEALSTYLALPRSYAERHQLEGGRTSHDILLEQLYLMDVKTRSVAEEVIRRDSRQLVAHGRYVAERYAPSTLDVPSEAQMAGLPPIEPLADPHQPRFN